MAKGFIEDTTLTAIGDAIRAKTGESGLLLPSAMPNAIASIVTGGGGGGGNGDFSNVVLGSITNSASYARGLNIPTSLSSESIKLLVLQGVVTNPRTYVYLPGFADGQRVGSDYYMPVVMYGQTGSSTTGAYGWSIFDKNYTLKASSNAMYGWALKRTDGEEAAQIGYYSTPPEGDLSNGWTKYNDQYVMASRQTVYFLYES